MSISNLNKILFLFLLLCFTLSSCVYPYYTKGAKEIRKAQREEKQRKRALAKKYQEELYFFSLQKKELYKLNAVLVTTFYSPVKQYKTNYEQKRKEQEQEASTLLGYGQSLKKESLLLYNKVERSLSKLKFKEKKVIEVPVIAEQAALVAINKKIKNLQQELNAIDALAEQRHYKRHKSYLRQQKKTQNPTALQEVYNSDVQVIYDAASEGKAEVIEAYLAVFSERYALETENISSINPLESEYIQSSSDYFLRPISFVDLRSRDSISTSKEPREKGVIEVDTSGSKEETVAPVTQDSTIQDALDTTLVVKDTLLLEEEVFSTEGIQQIVEYNAEDSMIYDLEQQKIFLYKQSKVIYENYNLDAGRIEFDFQSNLAIAKHGIDSSGKATEYPVFDDKQSRFESREIHYNFKSKKGKVYDAYTEESDGYLLSEETKFISGADSADADNIVYSKNCLYTNCDHANPHYGIRSSKAKIIPNKVIVLGPSYLEIMGAPTPIVLPFGFFPITKNKKSGLLLTFDFETILNSPDINYGPSMNGIGYYWAINDYWDFKITGDFFFRGSMSLHATSQYNKRYKYNGMLSMDYNRRKKGDKDTPSYTVSNDFSFAWRHSQDAKANPKQTFNADVRLMTSTYQQTSRTTDENFLKPQMNSNINYTRRLSKYWSLSMGMNLTQNRTNNTLSINAPNLRIGMAQRFPFKSKTTGLKERWYEKLSVSYNMSANNQLTIADTSLFDVDVWKAVADNMNYSVQHRPSINYRFKLFKHINVNPNINYSQNWYFYANKDNFDPTPVVEGNDTTKYGTVERVRDYGFYATHQLSAGISMNTQIFATGKFNIGRLHKVRTTFTPTIGMAWSPDYTNDAFWKYRDSVLTDTRYPDRYQIYSRFTGAPTSAQQANLNFGLTTRWEAKMHRSKRDTTSKDPFEKWILIPALSINGSYNFMADSFNMSVISMNANTVLWKKININFNTRFDPYTANPFTNVREHKFEISENKRLARMTSMSLNLSTNFRMNDLRRIFSRGKEQAQDDKAEQFEVLQSLNLSYNITLNRKYINAQEITEFTNNVLGFSTALRLSKNWNFNVSSGYDFKDKRITYPSISLVRDLHCWQMNFTWQPELQTWNFAIQVKTGSLRDALKYQARQDVGVPRF